MTYPFHCPTCGRSGTEDDGCELGGECPDEDCDGHIRRNADPDDLTIVDDDSDTTYTPFIDNENGTCGYTAERAGRTTHIYFCPSGGSDDGVPCVFVYIGASRLPWEAGAAHFYNLDEQIGVDPENYVRYHGVTEVPFGTPNIQEHPL